MRTSTPDRHEPELWIARAGGEIVRGLYLADEKATAIAEWYRFLIERGLPLP